MKISVVIPAFNEEKYIGSCLKSVNDQEIKADEIIVVDNNSTDKTKSIAEKMGAVVVMEKKQGMTHARNKGFESAKYRIIARCDADVIVPRNWIKKIKQNFETKGLDAFSGPIIYHDSFLKSASILPSYIYLESLRAISKGNRYLLGPNMAIKKSVWLKVKKFVNLDDSKVHEDIDLSLNIIKAGGKIGYDSSLAVKASSRRIKSKPKSFFLEYPARIAKTFLINKIKNNSRHSAYFFFVSMA